MLIFDIFILNNCLMHVRIVVSISNFLGLFLLQLATFYKTKQFYDIYQKVSISIIIITIFIFDIFTYCFYIKYQPCFYYKHGKCMKYVLKLSIVSRKFALVWICKWHWLRFNKSKLHILTFLVYNKTLLTSHCR